MSSLGWLLLKPQRSLRLWGPTAAHSSRGGEGGRGLVLTVRVWLKGPGPISFSARICRLRGERKEMVLKLFNLVQLLAPLGLKAKQLINSILYSLQMISLHLNDPADCSKETRCQWFSIGNFKGNKSPKNEARWPFSTDENDLLWLKGWSCIPMRISKKLPIWYPRIQLL